MNALGIFIIHLIVLILWAADSRALEYIIRKFNFRRSMPQPAEPEKNPFIVDNTNEGINTRFREMITMAYRNTPGRWDVWNDHPSTTGHDVPKVKKINFYDSERTLEPLFDSLLEELQKTEPEIYKIILKKHFFKSKRRPQKET